MGWNLATKYEEKAEVLNVFFASVFNGKTSGPQGNQTPELQDRDREQNKASVIQGEIVSDLLYHLDPSLQAGWDPFKDTERVGRSAHQGTFHHLSPALVYQWGPRWLEVGKYDAHLQEQSKGESRI